MGKTLYTAILALCIVPTVVLADCVPGHQERETDFPSADRVGALIGNGRSICKSLVYISRAAADTGAAIEPVLHFRDSAGRSFLMLASSVSDADRFLDRRVYGLQFSLVGLTPQGIPLAVQKNDPQRPYEGDIRESDLRVEEIKAALAKGEPAPAALRLRYRGTQGDFAVFYDLLGRQLFYRYREDRFDRRAEKKLVGLIEGQAYLVSGTFLGLRLEGAFAAPGSAEFKQFLSNRNGALEYEFGSATALRVEQILFR